MKLSVVTTLYKSAPYIQEFYERITAAAASITPNYELVFVNDGSPDNVLDLAQQLYDDDPHVVLIDLTRNYGHHKAAMTGLAHADGDLVMLIDVDLEEPPELLSAFYETLQENPQADVIYGQMVTRYGSQFRRVTGTLYYKFLDGLTGLNIPPNMLMARLMTRRYVYHLLQHRERRFSIEGLWHITGYTQLPYPVEKTYKGETSYTLRKRIALAVDGITAQSYKPLVYIAYLGIMLTIPSGIYILIVIAQWMFGYSREVWGWSSLIVSVWFLGGLNIFVLGIIAIYLSVMFEEIKPRPYTLVREVKRHDAETANPIQPDLVRNPEHNQSELEL